MCQALGENSQARSYSDWKKIFDDSELDGVIAKMLKLDAVKR
ncbi:hypothetical protein [Arthrobacter sp. 2MCAF14]